MSTFWSAVLPVIADEGLRYQLRYLDLCIYANLLLTPRGIEIHIGNDADAGVCPRIAAGGQRQAKTCVRLSCENDPRFGLVRDIVGQNNLDCDFGMVCESLTRRVESWRCITVSNQFIQQTQIR